MDVLPLSQKDRDAAEKKLSLKSKCEELHVKNLEMGKVTNRFEGILYQAMEETQKKKNLGFPGGAVVENLPGNAGDAGLSPGLGRSHMPRSN